MTFSYMFMPPPGPRDSSKCNKPNLTIPTIMVVASYALLVSATTDFGQRMLAKVGLGPQALDNPPALIEKEAQTEEPSDVDGFMPPPTFPPDQLALEPQ